MAEFRIERDTMGEVKVPSEAYYGAQTQRAYDNFPISGLRFHREFIRAIALIKQAAARANLKLGLLDRKVADAVDKAAQEVVDGRYDSQFVVDIFQTGSGTSTNMNANEIIANRAIELLGGQRGDRKLVHPNDHINMGQSTNDVFPAAIHVAAAETIQRQLLPSLELLKKALEGKAEEFSEIVKSGRTHLQDAVPVTLGQEFSAYTSMVDHSVQRVRIALEHLLELPLGGTAVGTGLNAHPRFAHMAIQEINTITRMNFRQAANLFEAMQGKDAAVFASGSLRTLAVSLTKIANDLRLMTSGPRTALNEIELPATQPGSSIMPGKVNPVVPEAITMVAAQVMGNDVAITMAGQSGQLELNIMMPVIAYDLLQSILILSNGCKVLAQKCIAGIKANDQTCLQYGERSLALVTAIAPIVGYDTAARIFKRALLEDISIREAILREKAVPPEKLDEILNLRELTKGGRAA